MASGEFTGFMKQTMRRRTELGCGASAKVVSSAKPRPATPATRSRESRHRAARSTTCHCSAALCSRPRACPELHIGQAEIISIRARKPGFRDIMASRSLHRSLQIRPSEGVITQCGRAGKRRTSTTTHADLNHAVDYDPVSPLC
jgi:hypothetical protein